MDVTKEEAVIAALKSCVLWRDMDGAGTLETYGVTDEQIRKPAQAALTTAQSEAAELRKELERLDEALRVIAERPGTGVDRWGNGINENEHMAEIAQDTLEGNEHHTVRYLKENRWPETQHEG